MPIAILQQPTSTSNSVVALLLIALSGLAACTPASNSLAFREREAALVPPELFKIAPKLAVAISPVHAEFANEQFTFSPESGATGTLLPNGEMLTVAHVFSEDVDLAKKSPENAVIEGASAPDGSHY